MRQNKEYFGLNMFILYENFILLVTQMYGFDLVRSFTG
jgi:hypothetical protein